MLALAADPNPRLSTHCFLVTSRSRFKPKHPQTRLRFEEGRTRLAGLSAFFDLWGFRPAQRNLALTSTWMHPHFSLHPDPSVCPLTFPTGIFVSTSAFRSICSIIESIPAPETHGQRCIHPFYPSTFPSRGRFIDSTSTTLAMSKLPDAWEDEWSSVVDVCLFEDSPGSLTDPISPRNRRRIPPTPPRQRRSPPKSPKPNGGLNKLNSIVNSGPKRTMQLHTI